LGKGGNAKDYFAKPIAEPLFYATCYSSLNRCHIYPSHGTRCRSDLDGVPYL